MPQSGESAALPYGVLRTRTCARVVDLETGTTHTRICTLRYPACEEVFYRDNCNVYNYWIDLYRVIRQTQDTTDLIAPKRTYVLLRTPYLLRYVCTCTKDLYRVILPCLICRRDGVPNVLYRNAVLRTAYFIPDYLQVRGMDYGVLRSNHGTKAAMITQLRSIQRRHQSPRR